MAFNAIRFAAMDMKDAATPKRVLAFAAAAIALPCLLCAVVLAAFGNPFSGFRNVAVAVVNLDQGAQIAGEERVLGDDVCDQLAARADGMQWHFVSQDEAREGLESGAFSMVCTIPEGFSRAVASAETADPEAAKLLVEYDEAAGAQMTEHGGAVLEGVRGAVGESIAREYWQAVLSEKSDTGEYLESSAESADALAEGADMAGQGNAAIASGLAGISQGAGALQSGLSALAQGAGALDSGLQQLSSSGDALVQGAQGVAQGAAAVADALAPDSELGTGASSLASGMGAAAQAMSGRIEALAAGFDAFMEGLGTAVDGDADSGVFGLADGADAASALVGGLISSLDASAATVGDASDQVTSAQSAVGQAQSQARTAAQSALAVVLDPDASDEELRTALAAAAVALDADAVSGDAASSSDATASGAGQTGVAQLLDSAASDLAAAEESLSLQENAAVPGSLAAAQAAAEKLSAAVAGVGAGVSALSAVISGEEAAALSAGMQALADPSIGAAAVLSAAAQGADGISMGLSALSSGASQVAQGAEQLSAGLTAYAGGLGAVASGTTALAQGAQGAADGTSALVQGAGALASGSSQLGEGITLIADGTRSLSESLLEQASGMAASDSVIRDQAGVLAFPVSVDDMQSAATLPYGQGLVPYLAAMFLWLACLIAGFALRPLNARMVMAGAHPLSAALAGFAPMALVAAVSSVLLLGVSQLASGLRVADPVLFYGLGIVAAVAFAAAAQLLMAAFGRAGGLVSAALLVLQAVCSGAAFPVETAPAAFGVLRAAMPLSYAADGLQAAVLGSSSGEIAVAAGVLAAFAVACVALTALVAMRRRTVTMEQLHPVYGGIHMSAR